LPYRIAASDGERVNHVSVSLNPTLADEPLAQQLSTLRSLLDDVDARLRVPPLFPLIARELIDQIGKLR
jgi:hypothetical protein